MNALRTELQGRFGGFALQLALQLPGSGISALFGPSGAGKSLALRALAGLEPSVRGELHCGDACWQDARTFLPTHRRRIGWLPQAQQLFAHRDVRGNLRYALQRRRADGPDLEEIAERTGISALLSRPIDALSGGERQRVALARALLAAPRWLLLDEPLSALDHAARAELSQLLRRLSRQLQLPMLLVSHAADEVERLADRVVLMRNGRSGAVRSLAETLADAESGLQQDAGPAAVFDLPIRARDQHGLCQLELDGELLHVPAAEASGLLRIRIAARDVVLWTQRPPPSSAQNLLALTLRALDSEPGSTVLVQGDTAGGRRLYARITAAARTQLDLHPGQTVYAQFKAVALGDA